MSTIHKLLIQKKDKEALEAIEKLNHDLNYFYSRKVNLPQPHIRLGEACVYHDYEKKTWLRAKIVKCDLDSEHCLVMLIDLGVVRFVNRSSLKEIFDRFVIDQCFVARAGLDALENLRDENIDEAHQAK